MNWQTENPWAAQEIPDLPPYTPTEPHKLVLLPMAVVLIMYEFYTVIYSIIVRNVTCLHNVYVHKNGQEEHNGTYISDQNNKNHICNSNSAPN